MDYKPKNRTDTRGLHPECLWMQAGIVKKKKCLQDYQCPACSFDRALRREAEKNKHSRGSINGQNRAKIEHWEDRMLRLPQMSRPCVHSMKGEIEFRPCTNSYKCASCDFEQYFDDIYIVHADLHPQDLLSVKGYKIPQGYYIYPGHSWMRMEENSIVKIGITEFAARILGLKDIGHITAPLVGKNISQGEREINIYKGNNLQADVLSPVSGVVMNFNAALLEKPELIWQKPYTEGWVLRVQANDLRHDLRNLTLGPQSEELLKQDLNRIFASLEEVQGPLAADGGELVDDVYGHLPQVGWENLRDIVFKT